MLKHRFSRSLVAVAVLVSLLVQGTWVLAGTTGALTGIVTRTDSAAPIAGAKVTVTSPSQTVTTTTDAGGHFTFASLSPDSYILSVEKSGFDPTTLAGITVQADQTQNVAIAAKASLRTIGLVTARSASDIVRPGTTADVYSISAAQQSAVQGLGGGGSLNQAYSAIASVPGVFVPQGQNGIYQSVYVRGGNFTQLGYEFDGVPIQRAFDQYPSTALSSLGQQELQVYTGAAPADAQSSGLAGFVNQVIRTGTYPGFATGSLSLGSPAFYHKAQFEFGGATANRLFSYYVGLAGYDQSFRFGSQWDGSEYDSTFGTPYNIVALGCGTRSATTGCYPNHAGAFNAFPIGPQGYVMGPFIYDFNDENLNRESVVNLHFGIPHKRDGGKDDVQVLFDNSWLLSPYEVSENAWGGVASNVANGSAVYNGATYSTCGSNQPPPCALLGPVGFNYLDSTIYNGPMGAKLTPGMVNAVQNYYVPNSPQDRQPNAAIDPAQRDTSNNRSGIFKLQYQKNIGTNAYARLYGYTFYSDWLEDGPESLEQNFTGGVSPDYELVTHTRGVVGTFADQLNAQHLINLTAGYTYANTVRWNNQWYDAPFFGGQAAAVLVSANHPTDGLCYGAPGSSSSKNALPVAYCGSPLQQFGIPAGSDAAAYVLPAAGIGGLALTPNSPVTLGNVGNYTCGGGPCEFLTVQNGMNGPYNTVAPAFSNVSLQDTWRPSPRLDVNAAIHYDDFLYNLPSTTVPLGPEPQAVSTLPRQLWQNSFNLFYCNQAGALVPATSPGKCPAGATPLNVNLNGQPANDYHTFSPRLAATYSTSPFDVVRASWGKYEQPASSAFQQYNNAGYNLPGAATNEAFYPLGYFDPTHQVYPETSYNLDLSWEHQTKGSDVSWKVTPFLRKTQNELYNVLLDPKTGFVSSVNIGALTAAGTELLLRKGDFARNGFAGQLSYTYTYGTVKFGSLPSGGTALDGVNAAIETYNAYTSACNKAGAKPAYCGSTTYANSGGGGPRSGSAAACFTPNGIPDPTCAAGDIANPYWNAPPQALFNASQSYVAYNQLPGTNINGSPVSSSYIIPHVATLLVNYKRDRFAVTPALQFEAGGRYGSPMMGSGIDPAGGCAPLGGSTAGDPRYPYGAAGGAPYNAATCPGSIVTPNFESKQFDNFGAYQEPSQLALSMQMAYQASSKVTLRLTAANLMVRCFGGSSEPWTQDVPYSGSSACWYGTPFGYVGNFYNPGNQIQPLVAHAYSPVFGNVFQEAYGGQANPFQLFLTAEFRL